MTAALLILLTSRTGEAQQVDLPSAATPAGGVQSGSEQLQLSAKGCAHTKITFVDEHHNLWYRATMKGLHLTSGKHLKVIGGLLPTWNLAAQAGSEGGTAPGNTFTAIAWTLPNQQIGASPYRDPRVRVVFVPSLNGPCKTP